ncbi:hypothetical protein GCM10010521_12570 [Streptomyces rameus]|uniref:Transposase n=1 Tax=Streptomyces rameus TaxID=68261 RepID=A0ABP6MVX0_9ACTN
MVATDRNARDADRLRQQAVQVGVKVAGPLEVTSDVGFRWQMETNALGTSRVTKSPPRPTRRTTRAADLHIVRGGLRRAPLSRRVLREQVRRRGHRRGLFFELASVTIAVSLIEPGGLPTAWATAGALPGPSVWTRGRNRLAPGFLPRSSAAARLSDSGPFGSTAAKGRGLC